jgi:hypothetical protein
MTRAAAVALAAIVTSSCAASLMTLPQGAGVAVADARTALAESTVACHGVTTITAEIAVSGSVNGQRLRARLIAGLAPPDSARLEAFALGQPVFIFVARGNDATLLLQRNNRIVEHGPPDAMLEAATGVPLDPATLRTTLTGCTTVPDWREARQFGDDWLVVPDRDGQVYLRRSPHVAPWRLVAAIHRDGSGAEWQAEYREVVSGVPRDVRLRSTDRKRFDLKLVLSQVEINEPLAAAVFRVQIPPSADPLTLDELRETGPLGSVAAPSRTPRSR